ncbi:MAG: DUF3576 domain-containing protein [Alphaproteobacteria bacterium CG_4_9_14_3_um_filter_47_13]|nr:MAG: DUF3576 domain-containing protein [Alphaproteobacteria bacterium CG_4_9_14_3_um_filter_47_13]
MHHFVFRHLAFTLLISSLLILSNCSSSVKKESKYPTGADRAATNDKIYEEAPSIFGNDGIGILGRSNDKEDYSGQAGIGVNSYLWRASLDTVSFMPLASADPFGGVILTDWYSPSEKTDERFKLNIFILDRQLRSDGIQVKAFRQVKRGNNWQDSDVAGDMTRQLEDAILTRARQLRVSQMGR